MSIRVNPPPRIRLSDGFVGNQLRLLERMQEIIYQLYKRTGGDDDAITTLENGELYEQGAQNHDLDEMGYDSDLAMVESFIEQKEIEESQIYLDLIERIEALENDQRTADNQENDDFIDLLFPDHQESKTVTGNIITLPTGVATPSVSDAFICETTGTTAITDFTDAENTQLIIVKANGTITVLGVAMNTGDLACFVNISGSWSHINL